MSLSFQFNSSVFNQKFRQNLDANKSRMAQAITASARELGATIKQRGDADIKSAGNFSSRWTNAFKVEVTPKSGTLLNCRIDVSHAIPEANIFETGGTIHGKPLLWIPLSYTGLKVRPRDFPGQLFFVKRKSGAPLLLALSDRLPKYFGIASVQIKKKFHIREICEQALRSLPSIYARFMKAG